MFISTLVGTRLHAGCRQESHLLTANYPQLMSKFTFILGIQKNVWQSLTQKCATQVYENVILLLEDVLFLNSQTFCKWTPSGPEKMSA